MFSSLPSVGTRSCRETKYLSLHPTMNFITAACISSSWFELIPILLSHLTTLTYLCIGKLLSKTICDLEIMKAIEYCSLLDKWILQFTYFRKDLMKRLWMLFAHFVWFKNWFFWNWKKKWGVYPNKWISKAASPQAQFLIPLICKTKCSKFPATHYQPIFWMLMHTKKAERKNEQHLAILTLFIKLH